MIERISVIDSHTAGEPTRVVIDGGPDLGDGSMTERLDRFRQSFDGYRAAVVNEPRGSDVLVGALLCPAKDTRSACGVIFFNNVGYLGMCGHGMIGVVATLKHLGRIDVGNLTIQTPVGNVVTTLHADHSVSIENVASYRSEEGVKTKVDGIGEIVGDVAWGGNWFYLVRQPVFDFSSTSRVELMRIASEIRLSVNRSGFPDVDHVELFGSSSSSDSDSRNFVLCPGGQYDRSPCGTGTSAKLACLAADGKLQPEQRWTQEGILGTTFQGEYRWSDATKQTIIPTITGRAHVVAESTLLLDPKDPFCWGIACTQNSQNSSSV